MDEIKLSVLEEKKTRISGSRKSKGKFSFVQKIKYFYLRFKYAHFGVESFTDEQLDDFINLLNAREMTYKKTVEDFEKNKEEIDKDLADKYERIGSLDSQSYQDLDGDKQLLNAASEAIQDKKEIDKKISDANGTLDAINLMKATATDELEAREVEREVARQEIEDEIEAAKATIEENSSEVAESEIKEEEEMKEKIDNQVDNMSLEDTSLIKPEDDYETQDLYNKIIEQNEKINAPVDPVINNPFNVKFPTTESLEVPDGFVENKEEPTQQPVEEFDNYAEIINQFNEALNNEYQKYSSTINDAIANLNNLVNSSFNVYVRNIKDMIDGCIAKVQEEDRRIAQEIIDSKDAEIKSEQDKNVELLKTNDGLTNDLNNANNTISERDKTIEELNATVNQKNSELDDKAAEIAKLNQANGNLETEKENLNKENDAKDAKIRELEAALAERNKDVADREEDIAKRDQEIANLNNKVDEVQKAKQAAEEAAAKRAEAIKAVLFAGGETKTEETKTM